MTFDEFFKKKRIDLVALEKAEPALFSEFKTHYEQMGEKSFDHTKKYWFNKLRRQFQLAPEIKTEKIHAANPLAEQTITESLIEGVAPPVIPKLGFAPKFKAGSTPKPPVAPDDKKEEVPKIADEQLTDKTTENVTPQAPKLGFVPKFKAGSTPKQNTDKADKKVEPVEPPADQPTENPTSAPKLGFTPKFRAGSTPKQNVDNAGEKEQPVEPSAGQPTENPAPAPKLGFTPKFKMGNIAKLPADHKSEEEEPVDPLTDEVKSEGKPGTNEEQAKAPDEPQTPKLGFKPRFNPKNIPPKGDE